MGRTIIVRSRCDSSKILYDGDVDSLSGANLSGANLSGADLRSANLSGADLRSADLSGANLRSADLSGANLRSANLRSANLRSADLSGANLSGANLSDVDSLSGADLRSTNLSGADLSGANLRSANLRSANLRSADLRSANLSGADLSGANLSGADLRSANLSSANLRSANLRSANLDKARGLHRMSAMLSAPKGFAYKATSMSGRSPTHPYNSIQYNVGEEVEVDFIEMSDRVECAAGINIAGLDYIEDNYSDESCYRLFLVSFDTSAENVCVPINGPGKFRVKKCFVERELDLEATLKAGRPVDKFNA